jgi:hypothetical protein
MTRESLTSTLRLQFSKSQWACECISHGALELEVVQKCFSESGVGTAVSNIMQRIRKGLHLVQVPVRPCYCVYPDSRYHVPYKFLTTRSFCLFSG